jgi:hypothetical protein
MLDGALTIPGTNVRMSVAEIFEEIDEAPKEIARPPLGQRHYPPPRDAKRAAPKRRPLSLQPLQPTDQLSSSERHRRPSS